MMDEQNETKKAYQKIVEDLGLFAGGPVMLPNPNVEDLGDRWPRAGRGTVVEVDLERGEILVLTSSNSLVYVGLHRLERKEG